MYVFSTKIDVPAGSTLAGFPDSADIPTSDPGCLEVSGIGGAAGGGWQICSVDALYPGILARQTMDGVAHSVVTASHTHYAPLLDPMKPSLGHFSPLTAERFQHGMHNAPHKTVAPDRCKILVGEVDVPVYRRFDFPDSAANVILSRYGRRFPNDAHPVDRNVYIFVFLQGELPLFGILYHACHPVTRHDGRAASSDYVGALRAAAAAHLGVDNWMFFLGCAGDVRPNLAKRRTTLLPRNRVNWRFREPELADELVVDAKYGDAAKRARLVAEFAVIEDDFRLHNRMLSVHGLCEVGIQQLDIGRDVSFVFLPFEVSHRYHLETLAEPSPPRRFIVSCAGDVYGYLPHLSQHRYGGYEVEGSRALMGLERRIAIESKDIWPSK